MHPPPRRVLAQVGVGLAAFAVASIVRLALEPWLGTQFGFLFFFPAVAAGAWLAGRYAGWTATVCSALLVWYVWIPPHYSLALHEPAMALNLLAFVVMAALMANAVAKARDSMGELEAAKKREADLRAEREAANQALQQQVSDLRQLHELNAKVQRAGDLSAMLDEILRGAVAVNGAQKGLLSLVAPGRDGVTVAASCGFDGEFLRAIEFVPSGSGACGWCYLKQRRVVVDDVALEPLFAPYRAAAAKAGFRAVFSTPLLGRSGKLIGVLSVHFAERHRPTEREMQLMDLYARSAADLIENAQLRDELQRELAQRGAVAEELRCANERFKLATQVETVTLFEQDQQLRYRWVFPQHAEHFDAVGRTDAELLPAAAAAPITTLKRDVLASGAMRRAVVRADLPTGTRYYDLSVLPKRSRVGAIEGVAGVAVDITDRKEAELAMTRAKDELARSNAVLEERVQQRTASMAELLAQMEAFSYSVSHDLRAPLRAVSAFATALKDDHSAMLTEEGRHLVERIVRGTERMNRLIGDVLTYTRVHRQELKLTPIGLGRCVCDVVQNTRELQPPNAVITWPDHLPSVMANEAFLVQVLSNLLGNAVKFVPAGRMPRVEVTAELRGDFVRVAIRDNGIGIRPEYQARLFGMFERLTVDRQYEGTGVGLAIVKRAVQRMGGSVGMESDGVNGSLFWFELPVVPAIEASPVSTSPFVLEQREVRTVG